MKFKHLLLVLIFAGGCGGAQTPKTAESAVPRGSRARAAARNLEIGDAMERRGHHLEASFYYEAALILAADEPFVLPKLIASQVRAGRLRAASVNTQRLIALAGPHPELTRLSELLAVYAPPLPQQQLSEAAP